MKKNYWLALGGGAARGFIHIWVLKYLEEHNVEISEISGTSMWAIIASLIAIRKNSQQIIKIIDSLNILKLTDLWLKDWVIKWKKIEQKLAEVFWNTQIEDLGINLSITATNIETGKIKIFKKWSIVDSIRASISLPGIFNPKKIGSHHYIDGGIMMNLPIEALNSKDIIAVSALKFGTGTIKKTNKILWINFESGFFQNNYEVLKRSILFMMKANEDTSIDTPNKNIQLIRPKFGKLDLADFNKVEQFVDLGYNAAQELKL